MFFGNDKNIETLSSLFLQIKEYLKTQKEVAVLSIVEKSIILLSTIVLVLVLLILGAMTLFYLSFVAAYWLEPHVGGMAQSYAVIAGALALLALIIYVCRNKLIYQPITRFIAKLFLTNKNSEQK